MLFLTFALVSVRLYIGLGEIQAVAVLWSSSPGLTQGRLSQSFRGGAAVRRWTCHLQMAGSVPSRFAST